MTTHDARLKDAGDESAGMLKQAAGASIGNEQLGAKRDAEECGSEARQNAVQTAQRTAAVCDPARRSDVNGAQSSGEPLVSIRGYDALEGDFRAHHQTNAARRRGPYEYYRLVYRYGYDLGADPRYRSADWPNVEQDARPRWEERNPGTWEQFKETIQYAWDTARGRRYDDR